MSWLASVRLVLVVVVALGTAGAGAAQPDAKAPGSPHAARYASEPTGEFMQTWLLCGPFPAGEFAPRAADLYRLTGFEEDALAATGGEAAAHPQPGDTVSFDGEERTWKLYTAPEAKVWLDDPISTRDLIFGYAFAEIEADQDTAAVLSLGSNDGVRVWLNGEQVFDFPQGRGLELDDDLIPVQLREGTNRLLLKIEERGNVWGFACRVLPVAHPVVAERLELFEVVPRRTGPPRIRARHDMATLDTFLESARFSVVHPVRPEQVLWEGAWDGSGEMPLAMNPPQHGQHTLRIHATLAGTAEWESTVSFMAGPMKRHTLFADGASDYEIVLLGENASESEQWAAVELQRWLKVAGGVELPIVVAPDSVAETSILIGYSPYVAALLDEEPSTPDPDDETLHYRSFGPTIAIWGGAERGTMYGVFSFLERELGCRWYTPSVEAIPARDAFEFSFLSHSESPTLRVRNDFYYEAFDPIWAARNRVNGAMQLREQPGGVEGYWSVHTFYPLMPPEEFFESHPEYYSLIDGERIHERAQLCLTNPEVFEIIVERLGAVMREQPGYLIYSLSQNDWHNACQCDPCQAIARDEGGEIGPVLDFVNRVAERLEPEFPDKYIGTLAYQYTRKPPKNMRPRDNVVIRLCSIEACFAHDFTSCEINAEFLDDLEQWREIAPKLYIWDYVVNFSHYLMPFPNFNVLQPNIRTFIDNHAIGIMEQGAYQSRGAEFAELRMYLLSKLLWDVETDQEAVIEDFMHGYYGRAGQHVRAYLDLLHSRITPDTHIFFNQQTEELLYTPEFVREASALFDQAEAVAESEAVRQRVELARLPVLYLKCRLLPHEAKLDGSYEKFSRIVERENVTHYAEAGVPHREAFHERMDALEVE